jgi:hypothetical protein
VDTLGHSWTPPTAHHTALPNVPWKTLTTSRSPNKHHIYGSIPTRSKASRWWTPHATDGSNDALPCANAAMNELLLTYLLLILLVMFVIVFIENNNDPFA